MSAVNFAEFYFRIRGRGLVIRGNSRGKRFQRLRSCFDAHHTETLPPNEAEYLEINLELARLTGFADRGNMSSVHPRWLFDELVHSGDGWQVSHRHIGPNADRFWRGFEEHVSDTSLICARYAELRHALEEKRHPRDPLETCTEIPLNLKGCSSALLEKFAAFRTRPAREVQS